MQHSGWTVAVQDTTPPPGAQVKSGQTGGKASSGKNLQHNSGDTKKSLGNWQGDKDLARGPKIWDDEKLKGDKGLARDPEILKETPEEAVDKDLARGPKGNKFTTFTTKSRKKAK